MNVFITYEKDGYGGQQVSHVWESKDDAIRSKMDDLSYMKLPEDELAKMAEQYVYEFNVEKY